MRLAAELTPEATFLGAHVVPTGADADAFVELVCTDMLAAAAPHARWIDAFCEVGAFDADQCRAVLTAGRDAGLGMRLHANQLGPGPGVQLAVELGCASADHCTYLTDDDVEALAASTTVATFLPATDFSTRQPYPDARRVIDAGATVALATNCNPGSSYTTSMSFVIALAVRDLHMTAEEASTAATLGGARSLQRDDVGWLGARLARRPRRPRRSWVRAPRVPTRRPADPRDDHRRSHDLTMRRWGRLIALAIVALGAPLSVLPAERRGARPGRHRSRRPPSSSATSPSSPCAPTCRSADRRALPARPGRHHLRAPRRRAARRVGRHAEDRPHRRRPRRWAGGPLDRPARQRPRSRAAPTRSGSARSAPHRRSTAASSKKAMSWSRSTGCTGSSTSGTTSTRATGRWPR